MKYSRIGVIIMLELIVLFAIDCSVGNLAGTGTETSTKGMVYGLVANQNGGPASHTVVQLISQTYNPVVDRPIGDSFIDTTDSTGLYRFSVHVRGAYDVQAENVIDKTRMLIAGVQINSDSMGLPTGTLEKPGAIRIALPDSADTANGYVYVPGTTIFRQAVNVGGFAILDSVPAGAIPAVYYGVRNNSTAPRAISAGVTVAPGGTTTVAYNAWKWSRKLYLNTTAGGAAVSGNVTGFPVLVRLTQSNFDFTQPQASGSDIRFSKSDGTPVPFEVERWDANGMQAEIWIKVDTVYGNDSTHFIVMYWGASTGSASNSAAVFDTASGNAGIWHLGPGLSDATPHANNGIDSSTTDTAGIIGRCRLFTSANRGFITIPKATCFDLTTRLTLSAWIKVTSFTYEWQTVLAKGDGAYRLHSDTIVKAAYFSLTNTDTANGGFQDVGGTTPINDHAWHLITGVFDGSTMQIYTDGVSEGTKTVGSPCLIDSMNVTIGENRGQSPRFFNGAIDEVRIMNTPMGADWVKLCYMSQKSGAALVVFK